MSDFFSPNSKFMNIIFVSIVNFIVYGHTTLNEADLVCKYC